MDDAELLFAWRNDPETRVNSVNTDPVSWDGHCNWLRASLQNPDRDLLIAEVGGVPVGTVRIDRGDETELSWTVAPDHRGNGIGKAMVALACPNGEVIAQIKPENIASRRIAASTGFHMEKGGELQLWRKP
jgi:RimJ/RimL family protein N-acetyltransferase